MRKGNFMEGVGLILQEGFVLVSVPFYSGGLIFSVTFWLLTFVVRLILAVIKAIPGL